MIAEATTLRAPLIRIRPPRPSRTTVAAASAFVEVLATWILLSAGPLSPAAGAAVAATLHLTAALSLALLVQDRSSRRWLAGSAVLALPLAGFAVAAVVLSARGRGSAVTERPDDAGSKRGLLHDRTRWMTEALSPCDRLDCGDEDRRFAALCVLARRADPEAIVVLRRAAASGDSDLSMSAALALDEIDEHAERRMMAPPVELEAMDA